MRLASCRELARTRPRARPGNSRVGALVVRAGVPSRRGWGGRGRQTQPAASRYVDDPTVTFVAGLGVLDETRPIGHRDRRADWLGVA